MIRVLHVGKKSKLRTLARTSTSTELILWVGWGQLCNEKLFFITWMIVVSPRDAAQPYVAHCIHGHHFWYHQRIVDEFLKTCFYNHHKLDHQFYGNLTKKVCTNASHFPQTKALSFSSKSGLYASNLRLSWRWISKIALVAAMVPRDLLHRSTSGWLGLVTRLNKGRELESSRDDLGVKTRNEHGSAQ